MEISLNWLKRYIDIEQVSLDELTDILTTIGLEVEGVEEREAIKGGLKGVKVGHVLTCEKHPNADKLSLTTVDVATGAPIQVVCGAPNVAAGQKVLVATVGTTLYNGDEPWQIKKGKIRGEVSEGMICAEDELGLGGGHDGIMVLPETAEVGLDAAKHLGIANDTIIDIGLTPNRSDATSHLGVAKDVYAYMKFHNIPTSGLSIPDISNGEAKHDLLPIKVDVIDKEACPRYSACTLVDVKVGPSPSWMQDLLRAIGVNPINNIVDITNFVLHELGQPLHAFDADKVGGKIIVQKLSEGTKFTTLDNQERILSSDDLMICDAEGLPMCIAGVYGGKDSGVTEETTRILLESAHFDAATIRKTSTRHLLRTDAAKVYEKGSDPAVTIQALKRAATLMVKYAGATVASSTVDNYPKTIHPNEIVVKYKTVRKILGVDISSETIHNILRALDMELVPIDEETVKVKVPTNKADVLREIDVIEEILRIYGFNQIPVPEKISMTLHYSTYPSKHMVKEQIANYLSNKGYNEIMGMSLVKSQYFTGSMSNYADKLVYINNTSNVHLDVMRPEMLVSGLLSVKHNLNRKNTDLKLYEIGKAYQGTGEDFKETEYLTIFIAGNEGNESWLSPAPKATTFYSVKGAVESVMRKLGIRKYQTSEIEDDKRFWYGLKHHQGPRTIVRFGQVQKEVLDALGIKEHVFYAEFDLSILVQLTKKQETVVDEISKYPSSRRDLALVVDDNVSFGDILAIIRKAGKKYVQDINLFDVYKNEEQLGANKKSYAVSIVMEDVDKTLTEKDIDKIISPIIKNCQDKLGAIIRE